LRRTKAMINRIPITKARINLGAVAKRAHLEGEYFILEKDGIPIAGIMAADELEDYLELQNPKVKKDIAEGWKAYQEGRVRDAREVLAELKGGKESRAAKVRKRK
jgi:antitoxin (DNA-binding transcriptional repressor) of toxin-antitoxin stability system